MFEFLIAFKWLPVACGKISLILVLLGVLVKVTATVAVPALIRWRNWGQPTETWPTIDPSKQSDTSENFRQPGDRNDGNPDS